ncbi:hypothetical protein [Bacillus albus]|uniref:hypothetical protein n=1 Tax=Bacillus albus TaxID=2026189 RepID=UPI0014194FB1|nr:hypothetical protein [Bacillus albus]
MDVLIFIIALSVFVFVVVAIVKMFIAIGKQGDERATFIKNKAMAEPFQIAIAFLIILSTNKRKYGDS